MKALAMPKANLYEPGPIREHPRVSREPHDKYPNDVFYGTAKDLIEAGVLQVHMVPEEKKQMSWQPRRLNGEKGPCGLPRYLTVSRMKSGLLKIVMKVDLDERARRSALLESRAQMSLPCVFAVRAASMTVLRQRGHLRLAWSADARG